MIRDLVHEWSPHKAVDYRYCDDQKYATVFVDEIDGADGALALWVTWYKDRGRTDGMWLLSSSKPPRAPTESECLAIVQALQPNYK